MSLATLAPDPQAEATAAVGVRAAVKVYGSGRTEVRALDGIDLDVPTGRFTAVMGPSGSGKSTLMHCMAGLDSLTSGNITISGRDLSGMSDRALTRLRRDHIGFVFQSFNLVPTLTAGENVTLPARLAKRRIDKAWLAELVRSVGLEQRLDHRPAELSGGQQQRVAVARALAGRPAVVFADEPTGNLDSRSGTEVLGLMRDAADALGQTIVMVTHDPTAAAHADHVVFLADGRVVDAVDDPTAARVLERMMALGG